MPLSDIAIRAAKPGAKPIKLSDERGLFLLVQRSGGKLNLKRGENQPKLSFVTF